MNKPKKIETKAPIPNIKKSKTPRCPLCDEQMLATLFGVHPINGVDRGYTVYRCLDLRCEGEIEEDD